MNVEDAAGWTGRVMRMLQVVTRLVAVNLLVIAGTVAGLGVFGAMPSAVAAATVLRPDAAADGILRPFLAAYRREFRRANLAGIPFLAAGLLLAADLAVLPRMPGAAAPALLVFSLSIAALLVVSWLVAVVALVHFDDRVPAVLRFSLVLPLTSPALGLGLLVTIVAWTLLCTAFPVLLPLAGAAVPLFVAGRLVEQALTRFTPVTPH